MVGCIFIILNLISPFTSLSSCLIHYLDFFILIFLIQQQVASDSQVILPSDDANSNTITTSFALPAGSYATAYLREVMSNDSFI